MIDGCEMKHDARGLCRRHYGIASRAGNLDSLGRGRLTEADRFHSKVRKGANCWEWTGGLDRGGYGKFSRQGGKYISAHRFAYELYNGPIPTGLMIDHICHNRGCVNPAHLRTVTQKQNQEHQRGANAGNKTSGVRGVSTCKGLRGKPWLVSIKHNGRTLHFGTYDTIAEAEEVAIAARARLFTHDDAHLWGKHEAEPSGAGG